MGMKKTFKRLLDYFEGDYIKTLTWFGVPNPGLGDVSPIDMVLLEKEDKLCQFINSALDGNNP